jgi:RimJ/RimL family protein N-acetyltransferase
MHLGAHMSIAGGVENAVLRGHSVGCKAITMSADISMNIIASGKLVVLRDRLSSDVDACTRWLTRGEWRLFDAPREDADVVYTSEQLERYRQKFLEECAQELPTPRKRAIIVTKDSHSIGRVMRYAQERFPQSWFVGIDICEDDCLNRGIGTEALTLGVDYLFGHSDIHHIGLDTWSLNPRMLRVAEKVGFVLEGAQREMIEWQGRWLDFVHFGMLRREWEAR